MRILGITALLLSTSMVPSFAQQEEKSSVPNQSQITPVQPERTPSNRSSPGNKIGSPRMMSASVAIGERSGMAREWGVWIRGAWSRSIWDE